MDIGATQKASFHLPGSRDVPFVHCTVGRCTSRRGIGADSADSGT